MGDVQGPEKVNNTCMKTMHAGTMDRGFSFIYHSLQEQQTCVTPPATPSWHLCYLIPSVFFEIITFNTPNCFRGLSTHHKKYLIITQQKTQVHNLVF
jgi:hypothetical protein